MKRNRNGISLFLKRKIDFFETENHWPYNTEYTLVTLHISFCRWSGHETLLIVNKGQWLHMKRLIFNLSWRYDKKWQYTTWTNDLQIQYSIRGRSQLSTFMKAYTAYAFWWPPPLSPKAYSKMLIFSKSYLLTATCTIYTTHWSFHIYVTIVINKTIDIKKIHLLYSASSLNIEKGKNARCFRDVWGAAVLHGSARRNRTFHCSVCSEYLTFYCRNIAEHIALDD